MTQYYINVTKEELEDLDTICFKAITDGESVCIISGDRYNELLEKMNQLEYNTQEVIADKVKVVIKELQEGAYPVPYSETTGEIVSETDKSNKLTYEDIKLIIDKVKDKNTGIGMLNERADAYEIHFRDLEDTGIFDVNAMAITDLVETVFGDKSKKIPSLAERITTACNNVTNNVTNTLKSYVTNSSLTNTLSKYASKDHTHDWERVNLADLKNPDNKKTTVAYLYVNKSMKLAWYTYNKMQPSKETAGTANTNKLFTLGETWAPIVPEDYRPSGIRWGSAIVTDDYKEKSTENVMGMIGVGTDGKIRMIINGPRKDGHYIRGNILWKY